MIKTITLEREDFDQIHDVIFDVLDFNPTDEQCQKFWDMLPNGIKGTALQWGTDDSVFRDDMFVWLKENKEKIIL